MILHVARTRFFLSAALLALAACSSGEEQDEAGPEETVTFEGNEQRSEDELREMIRGDLRRFEADRRPTALDDAAYRIEYQYRLDGFDRVKVTLPDNFVPARLAASGCLNPESVRVGPVTATRPT